MGDAQSMSYKYLKRWQKAYVGVATKVQKLYDSEKFFLDCAKKEKQRLLIQDNHESTSSCQCTTGNNSCSCFPDELTDQPDRELQASLAYAQALKLLDPKENRIAYYHLSKALTQAPSNINPGLRYTVQGEMSFYDYLLHFIGAFNYLGTDALTHLTKIQEHQKYFTPLEELTNIIFSSLDEGEIIAASMLIIRLADTYLFAIPYISKTFGQEIAAPLLDIAQTLLITSHDLASAVEAPGHLLQ